MTIRRVPAPIRSRTTTPTALRGSGSASASTGGSARTPIAASPRGPGCTMRAARKLTDGRDDYYAWSAAFISYVMRTAGAGARFPYAPSHYIYINIAKEMKLGRTSGWAMVAERVDEYAPAPGDLICFWRESKRPVTYEKLPARRFAAHCDIVVALREGADQRHRRQRQPCCDDEARAGYGGWAARRLQE